jgi:PhnB protein
MAKRTNIQKGYHTITPSLAFKGADNAIVWYKNIFGAEEKMRLDGPDNKVMHAELTIGDSMIFLAEENPQYKNKTPQTAGGNSVTLHVYVDDVDETMKKAVHNGASMLMAAEDQFYGDRCGSIEDPFGYTWVIASHFKDVSENEMRSKIEEMAHA